MRATALRLCIASVVIGVAATTPTAEAGDDQPDTGVGSILESIPDDDAGRLLDQFGPTAGEQVAVLGAGAWHDAGIDGSGVTIGVIDFFDVPRYWNEAEHGPRPAAGATAKCLKSGVDCTANFFDGIDDGGEDHGVAVVEAILDVAPGARIVVGQATTVSDYRALVDWFIERDVDVISRSLGSRYDGPGDGRGALNDVVADAVERGLLWVNSAGNNGDKKYYRHPVRLDGDLVAFGPSGIDTFLKFTGCIALGGVRWANDWDLPANQRTDYDVFLWESPSGDPAAGSIIARSQARQRLGAAPIEGPFTTECPAPGSSYFLQIRRIAGSPDGDVLEILDYGSGIAEYTSSAGSAAVSIVDSLVPGVVAVGSIDPAASGTIARYSSRGPSNDGRVLPDVVAPGNIFSTVKGRFGGTSASAAVVAGTAALYLDAELASDPTSLADLVRHLTIDRGEPGLDNAYGHGEVRLPDPPVARTDSPAKFVSLTAPTRFLDTRPSSAAGPAHLIGELSRGDIVDLPIAGVSDIPATGVTAVAVNVTSVHADRPSYVQAFPTEQATLGGFSNLNVDAPAQNRANFAIVPIGAEGSVSLYTTAGGHLVVDVLGWFESAPTSVSSGRFVALPQAERLLDSRTPPNGLLRSGEVLPVPMPTALSTAAAGDVSALVITVTAATPSDHGWVQAYPAARPDVIGLTSTVNTAPGTTVANTAIVPIDAGGIALTAQFAENGSSHVVVDAIGYITGPSAAISESGRYVAVTPGRAFDSRTTTGPLADAAPIAVDADAAPGSTIPNTATGMVWNAAIVGAQRAGFARTWPPGTAEPETSSLNWSSSGEIRAAAIVSATQGSRALFSIDDGVLNAPGPVGDLIVDVFGYFT